MTSELNMNKYDRILRTYGIDAVNKIQSSTLYIIGLKKGYAGEICKNLALTGINTIYLVGNEVIDEDDLKCWCYTNKKIGTKCAIVLSEYIRELNSMVNTIIVDNIEVLIHNSCTVVINNSIIDTININKKCRLYHSKMVYLLCSGFAGSVFVDCIEHTVMDLTGEKKDIIQIKDIIGDIIYCGEHNLIIGDKIYIKLYDKESNIIDPMCQDTVYRVVDTNKYNFKITQYTNTIQCISTNILPPNYTFINGTAHYVMVPTTFFHMELIEQDINNITTNLNNIIKKDYNNVDKKYLYTKDIICEPVTSIMAGFASNEIIKIISHKYTVLNQWLFWSDHSIFSNYDSCEEINMCYNNIIQEIQKQNILLVGCGALGCEWLKNLTMLNYNKKSGSAGLIDIIDYDNIEHSNLTRQLLFRTKDIGTSKCKTASNVIVDINPNMNVNGYNHKLSHDDIEFTNTIIKNKMIVINALDNTIARRYVDSICFDRLLPLFESGTMGTKGNTMPIIPYLTETYSNMTDPDDSKQFPVCTIKHFPNMIIHTIHWALDYFERYNRGPIYCNKYLNNPLFLDTLTLIDRNQAIDDINYFLHNIPRNWQDCVEKSCVLFEKLFNHDIIKLLDSFPIEHKIDGKLFWSQGKKCPVPIDFTSIYALYYIKSHVNILCYIYGLNNNFTDDDIKCIILYKKINNITSNNIISDITSNNITNDITSNNIISDITSNIIPPSYNLNPIIFEKDDDNNHHIAFINSMSNCRATNYNINTISDYEAKGIAGNIIPAIATTTSTIVGLIAIELLKYNNKSIAHNIEHYRSWFINMADNTIIYSEPVPSSVFTFGNIKINGWTKFTHIENSTLDFFIKKYEKIFETKIEMILYQSTLIYSEFTNNDITMNLYDILKDIILQKDNMIQLMLISENTMMELPLISISFTPLEI